MSWKTAASSWRARPTSCAPTPTSRSSTSASTRAGRASPTTTPSITNGASGGYPRRLMRLLLLLALSIASAALPAAAQSHLVQQCTGFGEAQYRKLDPSVDRIAALEFPAPTLERLDGKAGSQAIPPPLTFRGPLTYVTRPPLPTQFVLLLH